MFNALKYIRSLESVGFKREQAEAQVQLVMDTYEENVATKSDLAEVRSEISQTRSELKTEMADLRTELKSDMAGLRAELKSDISDLFIKFSSLLIGTVTLATAILGFLIKF